MRDLAGCGGLSTAAGDTSVLLAGGIFSAPRTGCGVPFVELLPEGAGLVTTEIRELCRLRRGKLLAPLMTPWPAWKRWVRWRCCCWVM
jgi:hypothetical protein